jgi:hypothetical protein
MEQLIAPFSDRPHFSFRREKCKVPLVRSTGWCSDDGFVKSGGVSMADGPQGSFRWCRETLAQSPPG